MHYDPLRMGTLCSPRHAVPAGRAVAFDELLTECLLYQAAEIEPPAGRGGSVPRGAAAAAIRSQGARCRPPAAGPGGAAG
ncbi:hypothetical protein HaLaN_25701, partial [Haematococcus lacustris]